MDEIDERLEQQHVLRVRADLRDQGKRGVGKSWCRGSLELSMVDDIPRLRLKRHRMTHSGAS